MTFDCVAGLLFRRAFKQFFEREKFRLSDICNIDWYEDKGFLESHFTVKLTGETKKVETVYNAFMDYFDEIRRRSR
jgi:hypothetical protein